MPLDERELSRCVRPAEAEELLGISHKSLYGLLARGELESFTVGTARRIPLASIRKYIASRSSRPGQASRG
jgi:excisionase family DNA binding protein